MCVLACMGSAGRSDGVQARSSNAGPTRSTNADDLRLLGSPMASTWRRKSIDQKSDSRALLTLARVALRLCSDEQRRIGPFGIGAVLLSAGRSILMSQSHATGAFSSSSCAPSEDSDCKTVVRIDQSLTRTAVSKDRLAAIALQAVNTASSFGRLARRRPKRCH